MSVSGKYIQKMSEASHVVFNGHLDDPCFRDIAIQKIKQLKENSVVLDKSGEFPILKGRNREYVNLIYKSIFGLCKTTGHPFKDEHTDSISKQTQEASK